MPISPMMSGLLFVSSAAVIAYFSTPNWLAKGIVFLFLTVPLWLWMRKRILKA